MTLKPFNQEKRNKKTMIIAGAVFLVAAVVLVAVSYSLYQKEDEGSLANGEARYPDASEVSYSTTYNAEVKTVADALNDLYTKLSQ
ncbi:MAG: hypothetical protein ACI31M_04710 [Bacilli bacterium]